MILLYIWIEKYKNIENLGFCFSSKFDINGERTSKESFHITLNENKDYIASFFGETIVDVKAIVAENGAGKSNLLDLIRKVNRNSPDIAGFIALYLDSDNRLLVKSHIRKISIKSGCRFSNIPLNTITSLDNHTFNQKGKGLPVQIFYSGIIDIGNPRHDDIVGEHNISCAAELKHLINNQRFNTSGISQSIQEKHIAFAASDLARSITQLRIPEFISVKFPRQTFMGKMIPGKDYATVRNLISSIDRKVRVTKGERVKSLSEGYMDKAILLSKLYFKLRFLRALLINLLEITYANLKLLIKKSSATNDLELTELYEKIQECDQLKVEYKYNGIDTIIEDIKILLAQQQAYPSEFIIPLVDRVLELIDNQAQVDDSLKEFRLPVSEIPGLYKLKKLYTSLGIHNDSGYCEVEEFMQISWEELSSGEKAFFDLFARTHAISPKVVQQTSEQDAILVLIDEGETSFHLQWQKDYMKLLLRFLTRCFENRNIQLIMTTHSPFVLSDLLRDNALFLARDALTKRCIPVSCPLKRHNTFASNIHQLFSESFFIRDCHVGSYAKQKLSEVITRLKDSRPLTTEEYDIFRKLINQIGEDLMRRKLLQLLEEKTPNEEIIDQQIMQLELRLNKLKLLKNEKNNCTGQAA